MTGPETTEIPEDPSQTRALPNDSPFLAAFRWARLRRKWLLFAGIIGVASYLRFSDLSLMDITIYVTEADLPKVQLNQKALVNVDAFPNKDYEGKVVFLSSTAEFTPKNIQTKDERTKLVFSVKVKVPNPDGTLKAGVPADVILHVANK